MSSVTAEEIQVSIDDAREAVADRDALLRLKDNADFKKLFLDGLFKEEPARLVELKAAPNMQGENNQAHMLKAIDSIGFLHQYFNRIIQLGYTAEEAIKQGELALEELAEEETL